MPFVADDYEEYLAEKAAMLGLTDPPDVTPERAVAPHERPAIIGACMAEQGFDITVTDHGYELDNLDGPQGTATVEALYVCDGRFPTDQRFSTTSPEQLEVFYTYDREVFIPCMESLGYDAAEMPTLETYLAYPAWDPFGEYTGDEGHRVALEVLAECESEPPPELLWPDLVTED